MAEQRRGNGRADRPAGQGGAVFRLGSIWRTRHGPWRWPIRRARRPMSRRCGTMRAAPPSRPRKTLASAEAEAAAIDAILKDTDWSVLQTWGIPAPPCSRSPRDVVLARAAQAGGKDADAIALWQKAAEAEDTIPYMEPPYWYYPVRRSLGRRCSRQASRKRPRRSLRGTRAGARRRAGAPRACEVGQGKGRRGRRQESRRRIRKGLAGRSCDAQSRTALSRSSLPKAWQIAFARKHGCKDAGLMRLNVSQCVPHVVFQRPPPEPLTCFSGSHPLAIARGEPPPSPGAPSPENRSFKA